MPRLRSFTLIAATPAVLLLVALMPVAAADARVGISVTSPAHAVPGRLTAVDVRLPANVAAVDGRLVVANDSVELVGVAPAGAGTALMPEAFAGGYAFAAYDLRPTHGRNIIQLVLDPQVAGAIDVRVQIDSAADAAGHRLPTLGSALSTVGRGAGIAVSAPDLASLPSYAPLRSADGVHSLTGAGAVSAADLDAARAAWTVTRSMGVACGTTAPDSNGDGCSDAVDIQAIAAALRSSGVADHQAVARHDLPQGHTFTVNSSADTQDAHVGDGRCADSHGRCTLRAAIQEADWDQGNDRIAFRIPGHGTPVIQLNSGLPLITSLAGTLTIDGYTQPGARINTAQYLTNGKPGVEIRGNGNNAGETLLYLTSGGNTIRGLILSNFYRGIMIDGPDAVGNRVVGNWIGFEADGTNTHNEFGILVNTGAKRNLVGSPDLADRNIIGNGKTAVDHYGPGTNGNISQDNVLCINPYGGQATCTLGEDHNFGPKYGLIGGTGPNERNVVGPTLFQAVEYSHGWNPNLKWGTDHKTTWQINHNRIIGNWLGFTADGSYKKSWRSGLVVTANDDGQAVHVYDGSNYTLVEDNWMASYHDGVTLSAPNTVGNIVRGNHIGISPSGEAAPLAGWGVVIRWGASGDEVLDNTISNAALGGIGIIDYVAHGDRISRNIVTNTSGPSIYLQHEPRHPGRWADGAVPPPVITLATRSSISGTGAPGATVEVYRADRASGRSGLPVRYLADVKVDASGRWSVAVSGLAPRDRVTALQFRADQNTSELGINVAVRRHG
jgi:CSLREA domain-containing protein